jgi:hypothetical protein
VVHNTAHMFFRFFTPFLFFILGANLLVAQTDSTEIKIENQPIETKKWFEKIQIRGYAQFRYNRLFETNPDLKCEQCDRSWGDNGGFFFRRIRIIFFGQLTKRVYFYIQPDFASSASATGLHFAQIRDAYFDIGLDDNNEFRFRLGQSKVPYGFENMQSSQNRLPLDRNDALNSAVSNERDIGVFFYWAPAEVRKRFNMLVNDGYKGSGDYGVFGIGAYNGQTANRPELNNNKHVAARLAYPFLIKDQIIEPAIQAYTGQFVIHPSQLSRNVKYKKDLTYLDQRQAATLVLYPRPFGFMAEYNIGRGPQYNPVTDSIEVRNLKGGYVTFNYRAKYKSQFFYPFVRYHYYEGGKKHETDARSYLVRELEMGVEWLPVRNFEIVAMYTISNRRFEDSVLRNNLQKGSLLRLQAQLNF